MGNLDACIERDSSGTQAELEQRIPQYVLDRARLGIAKLSAAKDALQVAVTHGSCIEYKQQMSDTLSYKLANVSLMRSLIVQIEVALEDIAANSG